MLLRDGAHEAICQACGSRYSFEALEIAESDLA
jgi:redox-regulated HSP33 family molecular chaperone